MESWMNNSILPTRHVNFILLGFPLHHTHRKKKTEHKKHLFVYHVYHPFHIPNSNFTQKQHPHPHPLPFLYILPPHGLAIKPSTLTRGPPVLLQQKKKKRYKTREIPPFSVFDFTSIQGAEICEGHFAWAKITFQAIQVHLIKRSLSLDESDTVSVGTCFLKNGTGHGQWWVWVFLGGHDKNEVFGVRTTTKNCGCVFSLKGTFITGGGKPCLT